jgi:2-polyprenyl-3-methyl-5-hydroxy-6-metoxy-1,4-benzoquinol methylase
MSHSERSDSDNLDGLFSPFLRRKRLSAARPYVRGRVLDFGCGTGLLARLPGITEYVGVDIDEEVLAYAASQNPGGMFIRPEQLSSLDDRRFDVITALAVIEHLEDGNEFLSKVKGFLAQGGLIVITTPDPRMDWAHGLGARLGLFARDSHDEHQNLMGKRALLAAARSSSLGVVRYRRFLLGVNQLLVLKNSP